MSYREIKFRGKDAFSEKWCYGVYIPAEFTTWREPSISDGYRRKEIDPETIGQYTGYKDINDSDIYEGDIVDFTVYENMGCDELKRRGVVKFDEGCWEIWKNVKTLYQGDFSYKLAGVFEYGCPVKVIGTIFDNPELLEEKHDGTD